MFKLIFEYRNIMVIIKKIQDFYFLVASILWAIHQYTFDIPEICRRYVNP